MYWARKCEAETDDVAEKLDPQGRRLGVPRLLVHVPVYRKSLQILGTSMDICNLAPDLESPNILDFLSAQAVCLRNGGAIVHLGKCGHECSISSIGAWNSGHSGLRLFIVLVGCLGNEAISAFEG